MSKKISINQMVGALEAMKILLPLMTNVVAKHNAEPGPLATSVDAIDVEQTEILQRANWLCSKLLRSPKEVLESYPKILGRYYGPQWSIYACVMTIKALCNISRIWPQTHAENLVKIKRLIEITMSRELREYDAKAWREDPLTSFEGKKDHMTYLSLLAWIISEYRFIGGAEEYDYLFKKCCEKLNRLMLSRPDMNLLSFPNTPFFSSDMLVTLVALHNHGLLFDDRYKSTIEKWTEKCATNWINSRNGLMVSTLRGNRKGPIRGCYNGLNNYWFTLWNEELAMEQYGLTKRSLYKTTGYLTGIKEYLHKEPKLAFDPNAGPIYEGLSPSGTAFMIGSATFFSDWEFRNAMLTTASRAGGDVRKGDMRHYKLGEFSICGEASVLAMRTNINFNHRNK